MNTFHSIHNNIRLIIDILRHGNTDQINLELDKLLNTSKILYSSKKDYEENFPKSEDVEQKVKLLASRRK